jgi:8-amino-7-oxononanoate synthase
MTESKNTSSNSLKSRRQAVEFTRKRPDADLMAKGTEPDTVKVISPLGFDMLDDYKKINLMRVAGKALGIQNPFFRSHDGHATATTSIEGKTVTNFGSYDYLGLNVEPRITQAAHIAIDQYGVSASASRVVAGERPIHSALENAIAAHYQTEDALVFVSGHATNVSTISALMQEGDLILHDSLIHNSIVVGSQLSGANRRSFRHNDMQALANLLEENRSRHKNVLVVVEGLYSMDGDLAPLDELVALKDRFGFWLMVDEAHSLGCVGKFGFGSFEHFGVDPNQVDIWMGTLSKTLASTGGYIAGSVALIDILKSHASSFVYSVGLPPALAAAAKDALEMLHEQPDRTAKLQSNSEYFLKTAEKCGLDCGDSDGFSVIPVMIGDSLLAAKLCQCLLERGFNVMPIVFPAVPMQSARLRFFITCAHTQEQIFGAVLATYEELTRLKSEGFAKDLPQEIFDN